MARFINIGIVVGRILVWINKTIGLNSVSKQVFQTDFHL